MEYKTGQVLVWKPAQKWRGAELVEVKELKAHGAAKLSNGWVVDADGVSEGTGRIPGGRVEEFTGEHDASAECWCKPEVGHVEEGGTRVWLHRGKQ